MVAVQIRDVPEETRAQLAAEARQRGVSLQTYLRETLEDLARAHRRRAWMAEIETRRVESRQHPRDATRPSATELIRKGREDGW